MKILLDTNIIIHREANGGIKEDIGTLFRWIDNLHYEKCIHPDTADEINKYQNPKLMKALRIKLDNYNLLKTVAPMNEDVLLVSNRFDSTANDFIDTRLLNEVYSNRVDLLISEDRKILLKAKALGIADRVYTIDSFLEKVVSENPNLIDYKVLSVRKEFFGNINLNDAFFDSFRSEYVGFDQWFSKKCDETAYIAMKDDKLLAFLYVKVENGKEPYHDIAPTFQPKTRLKIGTFKVIVNGFRLGERFLKIIFDNAVNYNVDEIYVTIFNNTLEQQRLISLVQDFGFLYWGEKGTTSGKEDVYVRDFNKGYNAKNPKLTYPYFSTNTNTYLVPIYPDYHTNLFPDSILRTESPTDFIEMAPFRNAISKVYISRSIERNLSSGDIIVFYRTGGYYASVITTIGIVESVIDKIESESSFVEICRKRSVFTDEELIEHWNYKKNYRPFVVNFLYTYSFPKKINLQQLIELGIVRDIGSAPRGFVKISKENFSDIIKETKTNTKLIVQ